MLVSKLQFLVFLFLSLFSGQCSAQFSWDSLDYCNNALFTHSKALLISEHWPNYCNLMARSVAWTVRCFRNNQCLHGAVDGTHADMAVEAILLTFSKKGFQKLVVGLHFILSHGTLEHYTVWDMDQSKDDHNMTTVFTDLKGIHLAFHSQ